LEFSK
jgi:hypothetical protein